MGKLRVVRVIACWIAVLLVMQPFYVFAEDQVTIVVDGRALELEAPPIIHNGRTLVPMRAVFEAHGIEPRWDAATKTITARPAGLPAVRLTIGESLTHLGESAFELEAPPIVENGRTYVPIRFISESLGSEVRWDGASRKVVIETGSGRMADDHAVSTPARPSASEPFSPTRDEIRAKWRQYAPTFAGDPYVERPSPSAPYKTGQLDPGFIRDGLNMANFARFVAGLPDDLSTTDELNELAQHGAVLLHAVGLLSHTPPKPSDMEEPFYETGYSSTASSNIATSKFSITGAPLDISSLLAPGSDMTLAAMVLSYLRDEDDANVPQVGHRRWILHPPLQYIGFGFSHEVYWEGDWEVFEQFSTMQVLDSSRAQPFDYDYVAWPAAGYFPVELFPVSEKYGSDPWSVSLHPDKYAEPDLNAITVKLTDLNSGKVWTFDASHNRLKRKASYFNVDVENIGIPYNIVFRPDDTAIYEDGSRYEVRITGLKDKQGTATEIVYETHFFAL